MKFLLFIIPIITFSQSLVWEQNFGEIFYDQGYFIESTDDGYIIAGRKGAISETIENTPSLSVDGNIRIIKIKQNSEGEYTLLNNNKNISFTNQTFNIDKYRFEMVFSGSLGIQLAGVHNSGIGGDPYIQPLLGNKFKIPYGTNNY